ncbi:MAG: acetyltransferase [Bacteroidia bacterium]|nr:acetyltransferase [Bacteroidia bacterium]
MENPVMIFGANTVGRTAKAILEGNDNVVYGFLDDDKTIHGTELDNVQVLGRTDDDGFLKLIGKKCDAFVAIDDNKVRKTIVKMLHELRKVQPVNAIHRTATVEPSAEMGHGNLIDMGVMIGASAKLGNHSLLHMGVSIGAAAELGDWVQVGQGSVINSGAIIEEDVFVGSGVTIVTGVTIGKGARVGAGSVVIAPVKAGDTVFGNPAQVVKA